MERQKRSCRLATEGLELVSSRTHLPSCRHPHAPLDPSTARRGSMDQCLDLEWVHLDSDPTLVPDLDLGSVLQDSVQIGLGSGPDLGLDLGHQDMGLMVASQDFKILWRAFCIA